MSFKKDGLHHIEQWRCCICWICGVVRIAWGWAAEHVLMALCRCGDKQMVEMVDRWIHTFPDYTVISS
jgi:hypothetical protein